MKVLNISNTFDAVTGGGEAERSFQLTKYLLKSGVDTKLLCLDTNLPAERKNIFGPDRVIALPILQRRFYIPKVSFSDLREYVRDVDFIHIMGHWTVLNALVYLAARLEKKPYAVCPAGSLPIFGRSKWFKRIYNLLVGRQLVRNATIKIAITEDEKKHFEAYGVDGYDIQVIPNGISESDFESKNTVGFRESKGLSDRRFILFLGRINPIKGPDLLLEAFIRTHKSLPERDLVFVGPDGGLLEELKQKVLSYGLSERIHFIGYLGGKEKSDAYHAAELLAIPSRSEAMSIVALEAGICGTPVLLTDQCGFDHLENVGGGWVVPATVEGLEAGLKRAYADENQIAKASLQIKTYVQSTFSWSVVIERYLILFESVINKG